MVTAPLPESTFHVPIPTVGIFPLKSAEPAEIQTVWSVPANDVVGLSSTVIVTSETEVQVPSVIAHSNTLSPVFKPVTMELGDKELLKTPAPEIKVQKPEPAVGVFAANVKDVLQIVVLTPADAISGGVQGGLFKLIPLELLEQQNNVNTIKNSI